MAKKSHISFWVTKEGFEKINGGLGYNPVKDRNITIYTIFCENEPYNRLWNFYQRYKSIVCHSCLKKSIDQIVFFADEWEKGFVAASIDLSQYILIKV